MTGFVPIDFRRAGKVLLVIGLICLLLRIVSYITNSFNLSNYILYFGLALILLSLYLIFVVPKE